MRSYQRLAFFAAIALIFCTSCESTPKADPKTVFGLEPKDTSLATFLYTNEENFTQAENAEDAIEMAQAARDRLEFLMRLSAQVEREGGSDFVRQFSLRQPYLEASIADMVSSARATANEDPELLSKIALIVPYDLQLPAEQAPIFRGVIGGRRAVKITVGLEIEAILEPGVPDKVTLPIEGDVGTTVYVQPVLPKGEGQTRDISISVRTPEQTNATAPVCYARSAHGRPSCFVSPGTHEAISITLNNYAARAVPVIIFVSGNERSVDAGLLSE